MKLYKNTPLFRWINPTRPWRGGLLCYLQGSLTGLGGKIMKWNVKQWLSEGYRARRPGMPAAYIYRALNWPDFYNGGAPAYEVKYGGAAIALIRFEGKGATVRALAAAARFPEITELDLVELALWVNKLRTASGLN